MTYCDNPGCRGHMSKYPDCLTAALDMTSEWADESTGDTDGFGVHVALHLIDHECRIKGSDYDLADVVVGAGTWCLVITDPVGFVGRRDYDSQQDAQDAFDLWDQQYSAYLDRRDAHEASITSSTGRIGA